MKKWIKVGVLIFLSCRLFALEGNSVANPDAVVNVDLVRITVLTPRLLRLEWSKENSFEDRASLTFINRNLSVPKYEVKKENGTLLLATEALTLRYKLGSGAFTKENLSIDIHSGGINSKWKMGDFNDGNLLGTTRTLDKCMAGFNAKTKKNVAVNVNKVVA